MHILQVHEFLDFVNDTLRENFASGDFLVEGEISDYRVSQGKWISFDLKDEEADAVLKCFATTWQIKTPLEDGMRVQVLGYPKVYERFGQFKMSVSGVQPVGEGALRRAYELLKKKLEDEGLFDPDRKRSLPRFPNRIGLITSRDAAAFGDFARILNNRWGGINVDHAHVHVQGKEAVADILGAFAYFNGLDKKDRPNVLVLTRGGGGLEDLHAFNDEEVARAVFKSKIPVVCAVGHERDESLCDYVADVRASTPSNAAERIVPNRTDISYEIEMMNSRMYDFMISEIGSQQVAVDNSIRTLVHFFDRKSGELNSLVSNLLIRSEAWVARIKEQIESRTRLIKNLDPKRILERGYSIVTSGGKVVKDAAKLDVGSEIKVQFAKGSADADVKKKYAG
ncbi:MAG: exodeoxyribonuclease VII large subunit [Candidatus Uhrbacteria bacterium]|nr:exodeoxyribonuclease VII large subunit [Patescibacteria group bacterium]MBU1906963.1 exodeoxyribonuclease VII large subunit [Patescibacteria group bacterium]